MHGTEKVFGIGLSRTGTSSLTHALRLLGYNSIHYPLCIVRKTGDTLHLDTRCVERYDALTDIPVARFYKELDALYPGSKFILTIRDQKSWAASMARLRYSLPFLMLFPRVRELIRDMFGAVSYDDEQFLIARYEQHKKEVLTYFEGRPNDLLLFDVREAGQWKRLCEFLDKTVPKAPFPWQNKGYAVAVSNVLDFLGIRNETF